MQVLETFKIKFGYNHPDTLTSMAGLASRYRNLGRWDRDEELEEEVIETRKIKLGADYPDMLTSMADLAWAYRKQGRWKEAEKLEVQILVYEELGQRVKKIHPARRNSHGLFTHAREVTMYPR